MLGSTECRAFLEIQFAGNATGERSLEGVMDSLRKLKERVG